MTVSAPSRTLFTELYPVKSTSIPALHAWQILASTSEKRSIGWKMAYRMRKNLGGHWVWAEDRLVTDLAVTADEIQSVLENLWQVTNANFGQIRELTSDRGWNPSPLTVAEFVAMGLIPDINQSIRNLLKNHRRKIRNGYVERDYYVRGWEFESKPVVSISISSAIYSNYILANLARTVDDPAKFLGLFVRDVTSDYKGEIVEIVGRLSDHRSRLEKWTTRDLMRKRIQEAPDDDLVMKVKASYNEGYDYISSVLQFVVRTMDYLRLNIDGQEALSSLQIKPQLRSSIVQEIADTIANSNLIRNQPISSSQFSTSFKTSHNLSIVPRVRLGDGYTCQADAKTVLRALRNHPMYRRSSDLEGKSMKIGVLNMIGDHPQGKLYLAEIRKELLAINFNVEFTSVERVNSDSQFEMEKAIDKLQAQEPSIIMGFLPDSSNRDNDDADSLYNQLKAYFVKNDVQSQFISESTIGNKYALANIILGIIGKTGNVPYVLVEKLPYADVVAGIDVARVATIRRSGSRSVPAVTRVYTSEGDFLRYILSERPIEGETLTRDLLRQMFPSKYFADKRVVIHRDGPWRGDEQGELYKWAEELGSTLYLVEVIKSGVPRIYQGGNVVDRPQKGDSIILNPKEALLVSSLPPHKNSTPRPLMVRTDDKLSIEQALHSVLSLTMLHYGAVRQPRLPVTIHYSDRIGYLALQGIKPSNSEGSKPYWL